MANRIPPKMTKQNKSVCRRLSRSLVGFASKDLCEAIPKSLSDSERLMMLLEQSFQYALSTVQKEVKFNEGFDTSTFRQKGTECWEKIKAIIEEKNLDKDAVDENGVCESYVEMKVKECNEAVAQMEAESEKWSDQVSYYREGLQKEIDSSYSFRCSELEKKNQLYDYSDIMRESSTMEESILDQISSLSSTKSTIEECLSIHKESNSALCRQCEKYYHQNVSSTPKTIIRRMIFHGHPSSK